MGQMLGDVATASLAEMGHLGFNPVEFDPVPFAQELLQSLWHIHGEKHKIDFESSGDFSHFVADKKLLQIILSNLVANAMKFTPEGGKVSVRIVREQNNAVFEVRDEGIGIPPDDRDQLFQPYFRASNVENIGGVGLGLKITQDCVELHQGRIEVESETGLGSNFRVVLPLARRT